MAATNYTSRNILWSFITALADGDLVTMTYLYREGLQRLHDGQGALLGRIASVYSDLISEAVGTKAKIVGNVDMTAFNYNSGIALSGLTVIVDENTTTAQTCTFSNAVTGPDVLLAQLTAQAGTNLIWSLNDSGQLVCECQTTGTGSAIALGAGTAHSTIWPSPTVTSPGAGTANDGASRIGVGAIGAIPAGTLRAFLVAIEPSISGLAASLAAKAAKAGDTFTGPVIFSGTTARARVRPVEILPDTSSAFGPTADVMVVPAFVGASITYTANVSSSPAMQEGDEITIINRGVNTGDSVIISQEGGTALATFDGGDYGFIVVGFDAVGDGGGPMAYVKRFGSENGTITLGAPYPLP